MWLHVQKTTLKETVLCGTITWSEMGKQTIQAKKVWSITIESILVFLSYLIFLANLCEEFNLQSGGPSSLFVLGAWSQVMRGLKNKALVCPRKQNPQWFW